MKGSAKAPAAKGMSNRIGASIRYLKQGIFIYKHLSISLREIETIVIGYLFVAASRLPDKLGRTKSFAQLFTMALRQYPRDTSQNSENKGGYTQPVRVTIGHISSKSIMHRFVHLYAVDRQSRNHETQAKNQ